MSLCPHLLLNDSKVAAYTLKQEALYICIYFLHTLYLKWCWFFSTFMCNFWFQVHLLCWIWILITVETLVVYVLKELLIDGWMSHITLSNFFQISKCTVFQRSTTCLINCTLNLSWGTKMWLKTKRKSVVLLLLKLLQSVGSSSPLMHNMSQNI